MARRLAAILATDVVGYSSLMAEDEAGTLAALHAHRTELFYPETEKRGGRIVKLMGDGALVEFPSVVDAVECALAIQAALAAGNGPIRLRIGINLGDVIIDGDDIYGDGVNIAARLETLAEPGGICVSAMVHESIGNRVEAAFADSGEHEVKGQRRPIRVWRWPAEGRTQPETAPLALPEKPSIAILPFDNRSADRDQVYFAEGIAEDIVTELSKFRSLFVIARNSSFAFRDQALEAKEIGRRLGVRYIVEGSVRRAGNRVRITAQLIDAVDDAHLWAERYDRDLEDIFAVQDEVTRAIVTTIEPTLAETERQRARRKPPESLDVWEAYQRGLWHLYQLTADGLAQGIVFLQRAIENDPDFAPAHAGVALAFYYKVILGFSGERERDLDQAREAGNRAVLLDASDCFAHMALGRTCTVRGEHDAAVRHCDRAIRLNPSYSWAHFGRAHSLWMSGRAEEALPSNAEAMRLSPHDPLLWAFLASRSLALTMLGRCEEALDWARRALELPNATLYASVAELAALGILGRDDEAAAALARARRFKPDVTRKFIDLVLPITDPGYHARFIEGLRKAGVPE
jgi:TolB-like protein/Flp pilus assembly protein TadD